MISRLISAAAPSMARCGAMPFTRSSSSQLFRMFSYSPKFGCAGSAEPASSARVRYRAASGFTGCRPPGGPRPRPRAHGSPGGHRPYSRRSRSPGGGCGPLSLVRRAPPRARGRRRPRGRRSGTGRGRRSRFGAPIARRRAGGGPRRPTRAGRARSRPCSGGRTWWRRTSRRAGPRWPRRSGVRRRGRRSTRRCRGG